MKKHIYLLEEILSLNSSDVKAIIDSGLSAQELIFSDDNYLQECLKLDRSVTSKFSSLKHLISEISLQELRNKVVIKCQAPDICTNRKLVFCYEEEIKERGAVYPRDE